MALCAACRNLNLPNLMGELAVVPDWWERGHSQSVPRGMVHLSDARQLPPSAAGGCPLCGIIVDALLQYDDSPSSPPAPRHPVHGHNKRDAAHLQHHLINSPIYLRPNHSPLKSTFPEDDVAGSWHVRGFKAFVPVDHGRLTAQIRLFAPRDSPASVSCDVVGRPALSSSDSPEAFDLVNRWMSTCLSKHTACKETLSGLAVDESSPPVLPTRVIHIGDPNRGIYPRLIETNGKTGYYSALSHCWGSPAHKRPLMTTQSTLQTHLAGISWDTLPRAYRDAMTATLRLGLAYIWIDSLCIVQDSHPDWLRESQRMGAVYEKARVTIAASHAADSSQPCFFARSPPPPSVELEHVTQTGERDGSIFAGPMPTDYVAISPELGPLAARAWATQEWLLSRRMVFYTAQCIVWSCKVVSQRETGGSFHSTARNQRWKVIVEKYSARLLTKSADRLIALEGLRTEMGKKRPNDVYCFGLWKNSMPDQLLWYSLEPAERARSSLGLPSWTWASTMHGVRFLDISEAKNACDRFHFDDSTKALTIRGVVRKAPRIAPFIAKLRGDPTVSAESWGLPGSPPNVPTVNLTHSILANDNDDMPLGWAVFDEPRTTNTDIMCLRMMSKRLSFTGKDNARKKAHREWVLLLQETDDDPATVHRVGVGVITTLVPWFVDVRIAQIALS